MSTFTRSIIASAFVFASVIPAAPQSANRTSPATPRVSPVAKLAETPADSAVCRTHCERLVTPKLSMAERDARAARCAHSMVPR
jgi:hypothetical protein